MCIRDRYEGDTRTFKIGYEGRIGSTQGLKHSAKYKLLLTRQKLSSKFACVEYYGITRSSFSWISKYFGGQIKYSRIEKYKFSNILSSDQER